MIKKSIFEKDLIAGMQKELHSQANGSEINLNQALDYLQSAMEILDEAGMKSNAQAISTILKKVADPIYKKKNPVKEMPSIQSLMEAGLTQKDLMEFGKGNPTAKAKVNQVLRSLGRTDKEIFNFIGPNNFMSEEDAEVLLDPSSSLGKMWEWMQKPTTPIDPEHPRPEEGEETELMKEFQKGEGVPSLPTPEPEVLEITPISKSEPSVAPSGKEISFKSIAQAISDMADQELAADEADARKHKKSTPKLNDPHIKNLTPEKQIENLKDHGTVFNMSDDGSYDLLNADITDELEVSDPEIPAEMDFEDEI